MSNLIKSILTGLLRYPLKQSLQTVSLAGEERHEFETDILSSHPPYRRSFNH